MYLSVSQEAQDLGFRWRSISDLTYWKYSANDRMAAEQWQLLTCFKDRVFSVTPTKHAPCVIIDSDNKEQAPLNAIHYILVQFGYEDSGFIHPSLRAESYDQVEFLDPRWSTAFFSLG
jgi:polyphosphate kinase 2 (PPK2 family)